MTDLNALSQDIHAQNVAAGWWKDWPRPIDAYKTKMFLVVTELAEAGEGVRKDLPDDKLPHHPMLHVELADAAIRLLDIGGAMGHDFSGLEYTQYQRTAAKEIDRFNNHLERLFYICQTVCSTGYLQHGGVVASVATVFVMANYVGLSDDEFIAIIQEKREFNRTRPDHQPENRAKDGGKKY